MQRGWILALATLCIFAVVAAVMLNLMPGPLKESDYLVIGTVATLVALLVLFLVVIASTRTRDVFFKKRRK